MRKQNDSQGEIKAQRSIEDTQDIWLRKKSPSTWRHRDRKKEKTEVEIWFKSTECASDGSTDAIRIELGAQGCLDYGRASKLHGQQILMVFLAKSSALERTMFPWHVKTRPYATTAAA